MAIFLFDILKVYVLADWFFGIVWWSCLLWRGILLLIPEIFVVVHFAKTIFNSLSGFIDWHQEIKYELIRQVDQENI